jgi:hypothetical protein
MKISRKRLDKMLFQDFVARSNKPFDEEKLYKQLADENIHVDVSNHSGISLIGYCNNIFVD